MISESERVQIRRWLGSPAIYTDSFQGLEEAITRTQSTADGGVRSTNATELAVRGWLAELACIEKRWKELLEEMQAYKLASMTVDPLRGLAGLKQIGRMYVGHLSDALDTKPFRDVFSAPDIGSSAGLRTGVG